VTDVTIRMWPASSIRGIVADERGEPIVGGRVQALRQEYIAGKPLWTRARIARPTDDRGAYVLSDLAPGEYLLAFEGLRNESSVGYDPAFHPASARASTATIVTLVPGQSRADVNIAATIRPAAGLVTVSGRLIGDGSPLPPMTVMLAPPDAPDPILDLEALTARSSANAEFLFPAVPPGEYRLIAASFPPIIGHVGAASTSSFSGYSFSSRSGAQAAGFAPPPSAPTWVLDRLLTVKGPLQGLALQMQQGAQIRGRVVLEGSGASSDLAVLRGIPLLVRPAYARELGRIPIGGVEPDGTFHTVGLPPGRYVIGLVPLSFAATLHGWYPVSLRVAGRETIGRPIELGTTDVNDVELVLGNRSMNVEGVVRGADGRPLPFARVILFPRDRALWNDQVASPAPRRIHHVVADRFGHYAAAWMPPGDYQLAAVTAPPEYWMAPDYLETLAPAATPVTLQPGDRPMVDLTAR
jgi:hypothetical protein